MDKNTSEIAKLTERISKDPKSKLFVPLAEEYKKAGDIEMSIHVLSEGLKNNPGYITARSFLGKLLIERGDLSGARKEFEEVVQAVPDNLMAQRKLGDILALQNRPDEALKHYKMVLSFNPKDQETALLIAEAEAGRDIKQHIAVPKTALVQDLSKTGGVQQVPVQQAPKVSSQSASAKQTAPASPAVSSVEKEEAEEVLVVEPLEPSEISELPSSLDQDLAKNNLDFLAETGEELLSVQETTENAADPFASGDPFAVEETVFQAPVQQQDELGETGPEESEKHADDFTTDTLAELYIAQGFFEKAVDIYERMLVDKPNSQGLKNKLAKVRAMAASADTAHGAPAADAIPDSTPGFNVGQDDAAGFDGFNAPEMEPAKDLQTGDWELPETNTMPLDRDAGAEPMEMPAGQFDVSFEPTEYVPPDAVPVHGEAEKAGSVYSTEPKHPVSRKSATNREQTVERLENWLRNIMKEK